MDTLFRLRFSLTNLSIHPWILSEKNYDICLIILFPSFLPYLLECFCKKELSLLPHLFTQYLISMNSGIFVLFCGLQFNIVIICFVAQIVAASTFVCSFQLTPRSFQQTPSFVECLLKCKVCSLLLGCRCL